MQPWTRKKPAVHATPLNHVGIWVDDLPKAVEWLADHGVRFAPGEYRRGAAGIRYLLPASQGERRVPIGGEGVLIELVPAPPAVVQAFAQLCHPMNIPDSDLEQSRAFLAPTLRPPPRSCPCSLSYHTRRASARRLKFGDPVGSPCSQPGSDRHGRGFMAIRPAVVALWSRIGTQGQ